MTSSRSVETAYALVLFGGYLTLWRIKRVRQRRATGRDPDVFDLATDPLQRFLAALAKVLTGGAVAIIVAHSLDLGAGTISRRLFDLGVLVYIGLVLGLVGLGLCALAQREMGASWRVGIDEVNRTKLVVSGIYRLVRNPTYLGLYLVIAGLWLIWPTCSVSLFALAFYLMLEVQVRCEEQHLLRLHGDAYREYASRTGRYLPWPWARGSDGPTRRGWRSP